MIKKFIYTVLMISCAFAISAEEKIKEIKFSQEEKAAMLNEAEDFIDIYSDRRQDLLADAIRHAMQGNTSELLKARQGRDVPYGLPEGVIKTDLSTVGANGGNIKMSLFRLMPQTDGIVRPLLVYFHGGGWTLGSINSCSKFCGDLAATGEVNVLAVDYALAPENPFPSGLSDCISAIDYAFDNAAQLGSDINAISIGGDSSGGNLAIAAAMIQNAGDEDKKTIKSIVLFYPVTKAYNDKSASWKKYSKGYGLDGRLMEAFIDAYQKDEANEYKGIDPAMLKSPGDASDELLRGLPPVLLIAAERDILNDQGSDFINRLNELNLNAERITFPGTTHLFITVDGQPAALKKSVAIAKYFLSRQASN